MHSICHVKVNEKVHVILIIISENSCYGSFQKKSTKWKLFWKIFLMENSIVWNNLPKATVKCLEEVSCPATSQGPLRGMMLTVPFLKVKEMYYGERKKHTRKSP